MIIGSDILSKFYLQMKILRLLVLQDGLEALDMVSEIGPDILILDIIMPHLDGLGVLEVYII